MSEHPLPVVGKSRLDRPIWYALAVVLLLAIGAGAFLYLLATKKQPEGESEPVAGRVVRAFQAEQATHRMAITAYGTSRAAEVWTAIAEVKGRINELHPLFEPGEIFTDEENNDLLVGIDPTDYELAEKRLTAEVRAKQKQLAEHDQNEANLKAILKLQQRQLELARSEYERQWEAFQRGAVTESVVERAQDAYIRAQTAVQQTRNSLALIPVQRELTRAQLDAARAALAQAEQDLKDTRILVPQPMRCATKSVELRQYVREGEALGTFFALDLAEVVAMIEARKMQSLFPGGPDVFEQRGPFNLITSPEVKNLLKELRIPVEVRWAVGDMPSVRYGRVARIGSSLDPATRSVPIIIEVPDPYTDVIPGKKPPLVPDVFCEVTIYGDTLSGVYVIPREALRDNRVYVARRNGAVLEVPQHAADRAEETGDEGSELLLDAELQFAEVELVALEEDVAVVRASQDAGAAETLMPGDAIVLTDLFPASKGMPLRVRIEHNPVKARGSIDFPEEVFADWDTPGSAAAIPKGDSPIHRPGTGSFFGPSGPKNVPVPFAAEGDSPIFAARKLGQSPAARKLGQSPAARKLGQSPADSSEAAP